MERDKVKKKGESPMAEVPEWGRQHIRMALSWCLGYLGADRFYNGQIGWGIIKLLDGNR